MLILLLASSSRLIIPPLQSKCILNTRLIFLKAFHFLPDTGLTMIYYLVSSLMPQEGVIFSQKDQNNLVHHFWK